MNLCKNEKLDILTQLLRIEKRLIECNLILSVDVEEFIASVIYIDKERYLKMAMKLDANDPDILLRKKKQIIC